MPQPHDAALADNSEIEHLRRVAAVAGLKPRQIVRPRHHHAVLSGRRFHYVEWGARGNPPILFLHGGNQSARTWDIVCLSLADRFHCIALDQRGHGDSEWSYEGDYAPETHAGDVAALIDQLGWGRFVLVGMSMGCLNGMHYAAHHTEQVAGFVAVDAGPYIQPAAGAEIIDFVSENLSHPSLDAFVEAAMRFNPKRKPALLRHSLRHTVREAADGTWSWKADRRHKFDVETMRDWLTGLERLLPSMTFPTLVMRGAESRILSENDMRRFADALPDGRAAIIPDAGHSIQGDNPKGFLAAFEGFLDTLAHDHGP